MLFWGKCRSKLCQFKHKEVNNDNTENEERTVNDIYDIFIKLSEIEQRETKDIFCDLYCNPGMDCHICSDETFEAFIGCDVLNVTEDFENYDDEESDIIPYYPCDKCEKRFKNLAELQTHFTSNHTADKVLKCKLNDCKFVANETNMLTMHIGVHHLDFVRRKL